MAVEMAWAHAKTGGRVSIEGVPRGLACEAVCMSCGTPVVAKQGEINAWHFAHHVEDGTPCSGESYVHALVKDAFAGAVGRVLPLPGIDRKHYPRITSAKLENGDAIPNRRVDVLLELSWDLPWHIGAGALAVEVCVTNPKDEAFRRDAESVGFPVLEVRYREDQAGTGSLEGLVDAAAGGLFLVTPRALEGRAEWEEIRAEMETASRMRRDQAGRLATLEHQLGRLRRIRVELDADLRRQRGTQERLKQQIEHLEDACDQARASREAAAQRLEDAKASLHRQRRETRDMGKETERLKAVFEEKGARSPFRPAAEFPGPVPPGFSRQAAWELVGHYERKYWKLAKRTGTRI